MAKVRPSWNPTMKPKDGARVARYELPGRRWYIAVCESCRWVDMGWKHKQWAKDAAAAHNQARHVTLPANPKNCRGCDTEFGADVDCPLHGAKARG